MSERKRPPPNERAQRPREPVQPKPKRFRQYASKRDGIEKAEMRPPKQYLRADGPDLERREFDSRLDFRAVSRVFPLRGRPRRSGPGRCRVHVCLNRRELTQFTPECHACAPGAPASADLWPPF